LRLSTTCHAPAVLALMHIGRAFSHVVASDRQPASWMLSCTSGKEIDAIKEGRPNLAGA
jgi:hypothetical protein